MDTKMVRFEVDISHASEQLKDAFGESVSLLFDTKKKIVQAMPDLVLLIERRIAAWLNANGIDKQLNHSLAYRIMNHRLERGGVEKPTITEILHGEFTDA